MRSIKVSEIDVGRVWKTHRAKASLTAFCVLVAIFDTFWKTLSPIAAGALALAVVPWVIGIIERISAPGGFDIIFAKAGKQIDAAQPKPDNEDLDAFKYFEGNDPNLAIAMLRVQIERQLREIAERSDVNLEPRGRPLNIKSLAVALANAEAIPREAVSLLSDLMPVMNQAVHGVTLSDNATEFALDYGPKILALLKSSAS